MELAEKKAPLYEFYTGGTINDSVCQAENEFFAMAVIPSKHPIRQAVETVRIKTVADRETVENIYRLYRIQQYQELQFVDGTPSDTVKFNFEYFKGKCTSEEKAIGARKCREELKAEFRKLNDSFAKRYGENTGIAASGVPNVRRLLSFHIRGLLDWETDIPGTRFFSFDKKIFFTKK